jgi:hypothetical protein
MNRDQAIEVLKFAGFTQDWDKTGNQWDWMHTTDDKGFPVRSIILMGTETEARAKSKEMRQYCNTTSGVSDFEEVFKSTLAAIKAWEGSEHETS